MPSPLPTYSVEIDHHGMMYRFVGVPDETLRWLRARWHSGTDIQIKEITDRLGQPKSSAPKPRATRLPSLAIAEETTSGVSCDQLPPATCLNQRFGNDVVAVKVAASEWPALRAWMKRRGLVDTNDVWAPWPECRVRIADGEITGSGKAGGSNSGHQAP